MVVVPGGMLGRHPDTDHLRWHSYVIVTGSMEPGISAGDVVLASPDPVIEDTVGKVITFENPGREGRYPHPQGGVDR